MEREGFVSCSHPEPRKLVERQGPAGSWGLVTGQHSGQSCHQALSSLPRLLRASTSLHL